MNYKYRNQNNVEKTEHLGRTEYRKRPQSKLKFRIQMHMSSPKNKTQTQEQMQSDDGGISNQ